MKLENGLAFITGLANATLLIHLAAVSLGLASQYVSDANSPWKRCSRRYSRSRAAAHLSPGADRLRQGNFATPPRLCFGQIVHYEQYDMSKYRDDAAMERFISTLTLQGSYGKGR